MRAERVTDSRTAEQAVDGGHATPEELGEIPEAWRERASHPDGWLVLLHGEVLCRV
ncbi:hypothetical protein FHR84_004416 [Actinopolyspora biskrensis]|uniref:Uncharacterized protein n=1 Tax=Actinopolyspora biskrensis TaxID=1470178 RepID=A0A852Z4V0_9ACTN|nr:hypothetical protein [Actinopolyspora biskrensis]NYH81042.1 hypothetical protein [Actinopolyspora biskrensis]